MANFVTPCPDCPRLYRAIGGDGPRPAPVLAIMERPGRDENQQGRVACGKTGQELDELYFPLAGLDRSEIRVCNTVMCWQDNNKTPTDKDVERCAIHHLPEEIKRTNPEVILLLGSTASKLCPGVRLELHHGIPQPTSKVGSVLGWDGWVIPMFHPSIGLHESRFMTVCMEDWAGLKDIIEQDHYADDPPPERTEYYLWQRGCEWLREGRLSVDTESHAGKPWSVQVSAHPARGSLFRCSDRDSMGFLSELLNNEMNDVVLHNAAYDLEVLRRLGIQIKSYRDTMQEAFHLGNLPQGLKALTYRLFRHTMTSYAETVRPASIKALYSWMTEAFCIAQLDLCYTERVQLKTKIKETVKSGGLDKLLTRLLRLTDSDSEYDPWERLDDFYKDPLNEWMIPIIESRIGSYPTLGIANCSMDQAVQYAVGDADFTGRVAVELARRRDESFQIHESDRDPR